MINQTPTLRLEPSRSDRYVMDARRRELHNQLARYLTDGDATRLLSGQPVDAEIDPANEAAVLALMPAVVRFVREGR